MRLYTQAKKVTGVRPVRLTLAGFALPTVGRAGRILLRGGGDMAGADELKWARRLKQETIRRLYTLDAKGIVNEDLINEVGYAMLGRCESIRTATRAHVGRATCPRCKAMIGRAEPDWTEWRKDEPMVCGCGWSTTWGEYQATYKRKQLVGGNAYPAFRAFIDDWPRVRLPRDKMMLIDRLIHACHVDALERWARPAACNLIEGTMTELIPFLDELAYGPQSSPGVREQRKTWDERPQLAAWRRWKAGAATTPWRSDDQA
jgi:hypothetical protein